MEIRKVFYRGISLLFCIYALLTLAGILFQRANRLDFIAFSKSLVLWLMVLVFFCSCALLLIRYAYAGLRGESATANYVIILFSVVVPRLVWILVFDVIPQADFKFYDSLAEKLARGEAAGQGYVSLFPHTYGYPSFLSLFYRLFGPDYHLAQGLNIVLGLGIAVLVYHLGESLFSRKAGLFSAVFWALWPSQILYASLVASEALFTFLLLLCAWLFVRVLERERPSSFAYAGIGALLAVTNSIRPFGVIFIVAGVIIFLIQKWTFRLKLRELFNRVLIPLLSLILTFTVCTSLVSAGISQAIHMEVARFPIGFNLLTGSNLQSSGRWNPEDAQLLSDKVDWGPFDPQAVQNQLKEIAFRRIQEQGLGNLSLLVEKYKILWASDDDSITYIRTSLKADSRSKALFHSLSGYLRLACNGYFLLMVVFCLIFVLGCLIQKKGETHAAFFFLIIIGTVITHLLLEAAGRYHYPVISLLALIAGGGVQVLCSGFKLIKEQPRGNTYRKEKTNA